MRGLRGFLFEVCFLQERRDPNQISCSLIVSCEKGITSNNENHLVLCSRIVAFQYLAYDFG